MFDNDSRYQTIMGDGDEDAYVWWPAAISNDDGWWWWRCLCLITSCVIKLWWVMKVKVHMSDTSCVIKRWWVMVKTMLMPANELRYQTMMGDEDENTYVWYRVASSNDDGWWWWWWRWLCLITRTKEGADQV